MDGKLLEILACPICKGPVEYQPDNEWLVCRADRLAYPVRDGIPVMLQDEAQALDMDGNPATAGGLKGDAAEPR